MTKQAAYRMPGAGEDDGSEERGREQIDVVKSGAGSRTVEDASASPTGDVLNRSTQDREIGKRQNNEERQAEREASGD